MDDDDDDDPRRRDGEPRDEYARIFQLPRERERERDGVCLSFLLNSFLKNRLRGRDGRMGARGVARRFGSRRRPTVVYRYSRFRFFQIWSGDFGHEKGLFWKARRQFPTATVKTHYGSPQIDHCRWGGQVATGTCPRVTSRQPIRNNPQRSPART